MKRSLGIIATAICLFLSNQAMATMYEAESGTFVSPAKSNKNHTGYTGAGFVDGFINSTTARVTISVTVTSAGGYIIALRYSAGAGTSTNTGLYVNGTKIKNITCAATANWDTWANEVETVSLNAGNNTITYQAGGNGYCINLDNINVQGIQSIFDVTNPVFNNNVAWTPEWSATRNDDTPIEAAIAAAISSGYGGTIYFPKGHYNVRKTKFIGDGNTTTSAWLAGTDISIKGDGRDVSIIYARTSSSVFAFRGGRDGLSPNAVYSQARSSENNKIYDFSILKVNDGAFTCPSGGVALDLRGTAGGLVDNVEIRTDGSATFQYGVKLLRDESRIHHVNVADGLCGIHLEGHCNSTSITESLFWRNGIGIYVQGGASIRIQNNTFGDNGNAGIYVETNKAAVPTAILGLVISGNEMEGNGVGGTAKVLVDNSIYIRNSLPTPTDRFHDLVRGITISDNYFNLDGCKTSNGSYLQTPYKIPSNIQKSEITFNRNVYKVNTNTNPSRLQILTEGLTTDGTIPVPSP